MEIKNRKTVFDNLKKYSPFCKEEDWIEVTEWTNGEGWDININDEKRISLHYDELTAINYLIKCLDYEETDKKE